MSDVKKVNDVKVKEQYHIGISDRFAALENLQANVDINMTCKVLERILKREPETVR
jgi:hypothetical protein